MGVKVEEKRFDEWMELKENLHFKNRLRTIHVGEIWWCAMGENVGVEINGKHKAYSRPVLIFKKLSRFGFMGIPLTSQFHEGNWYASFTFRNKMQFAALAQARVMSVSRLYGKMGDTTKGDFERVRSAFGKLYLGVE